MSWEPWLKFEPIDIQEKPDESVQYQEDNMERIHNSFRLPHELIEVRRGEIGKHGGKSVNN